MRRVGIDRAETSQIIVPPWIVSHYMFIINGTYGSLLIDQLASGGSKHGSGDTHETWSLRDRLSARRGRDG